MAKSDIEIELDETHDVNARSWLVKANDAESDFPVQNLPFGVYRKAGTDDVFRGCIAIGDCVLDLAAADAATGPVLNDLASAGPSNWKSLRHKLFTLLTNDAHEKRVSKYLPLCLMWSWGVPSTAAITRISIPLTITHSMRAVFFDRMPR